MKLLRKSGGSHFFDSLMPAGIRPAGIRPAGREEQREKWVQTRG